MKQAIVYAIENQKGGCGKTTTSIQLIDYASNILHKRVLAIDMDPQGTLTRSLAPEGGESNDLYSFIMTRPKREMEYLPFHQVNENLYLLKSTKRLKSINMETELDSPKMLSEALEPFKNLFDFVIIDGCPEISQLTHNLFTATDKVVVPMNPGIYSIEGLVDLSNEVNLIRKMYNPNLQIAGLLLSNIDKNTNAEKAINEMIKDCCEYLKTKQYETTIYHSTVVNDAQIEKKPIRVYKKNAPVAIAYSALAKEVFGE